MHQQLQEAKDNVLYLLENPDASVNFHDIVYWASEVKRLRDELKAQII